MTAPRTLRAAYRQAVAEVDVQLLQRHVGAARTVSRLARQAHGQAEAEEVRQAWGLVLYGCRRVGEAVQRQADPALKAEQDQAFARQFFAACQELADADRQAEPV